MGFWDYFRRPPPIRDPAELADFIDRQAAFLVQKGIYEYARARAGRFSHVMFTEKPFLDLVNRSRWQAFPMGLAMVAEMVEGQLRPAAGEARGAMLEAVTALVLSVFDRYPQPPELDEATWRQGREELVRRLAQIGSHPVKPVKDIPDSFVERYFALMPVHERMRTADQPTTLSYLKLTLINFHDELAKRMDPAQMVAALGAR